MGFLLNVESFINLYWGQWGLLLLHSSKKEEKDAFYSFRLKDEVGLDVCIDEQVCESLVSYLWK